MQVTPGRTNGWWISPVIPTVANAVLAALWLFSTFGGWGEAAFCGEGLEQDLDCADGFDVAILASAAPATGAMLLAVLAWSVPAFRRNPYRLDKLLTTAALLWVAAEAVLFIGGYLAQP